MKDPFIVRSLATDNGTYFYAVNLAPCDVKVKLQLPEKGFAGLFGVKYQDLSTDKMLSGDVIDLKPYQLRSFLIPNEKVEIKAASAIITDEAKAFYEKAFADLERDMKTLESNNISCAEEHKMLAGIKEKVAAGQLAEAHRLSNSFMLTTMRSKLPNIEKFAAQQKMMDKGHYAVNCGFYDFSEHSKKMFFPDQGFKGNNYYGYVLKEGNPMTQIMGCMRDITGIHGTDVPEIYRTETYSIDGYYFKVPNGTYNVRLYMKVGYKKAFKKGNFQFKINAQDKPWADVDLYELCKHDVDYAGVLERQVTVDNGLLKLDFLVLPTEPGQKPSNGTERMLNGIEVIPVSAK